MPKIFRWALEASASKELWTYKNKIVVHNNPDEMAWLFERSIATGKHRIVELPSHDLGRPFIRLRHHPDMDDIEWPLNRADFY